MKYLDLLLLIYSLTFSVLFVVLGLTHAGGGGYFVPTLLFLPLSLILVHDTLTKIKQALTSPERTIHPTILPTGSSYTGEANQPRRPFKTLLSHQPRIFYVTSALYLVLLGFFMYKLATFNQSSLVSPIPTRDLVATGQ